MDMNLPGVDNSEVTSSSPQIIWEDFSRPIENQSHLEVLQSGTKVKTVIGNNEAIITGVCIRFDNVQYELSYFKDGEHKSFWVYESEFTTTVSTKQKIGFIK